MIYLQGSGLPRKTLVDTFCPDVIIINVPFTLKYVLGLNYKLHGYLFIGGLKVIQ